MAPTEVPLRILMQSILKGGERFPKRVQVHPPYVPQAMRQSSTDFHPFGFHAARGRNVGAQRFNEPTGVVIAPTGGNLPRMEFRFWIGSRQSASRFSICRGCKKIQHLSHERKEHMDKLKCTDLLVRAYTLLRKDKNCVICDARTNQTVWGVPLCTPLCEDRWMFNPQRSAALEAAIELVYKAGWKTPPQEVKIATEEDMRAAIDAAAGEGMMEAWGIQREY